MRTRRLLMAGGAIVLGGIAAALVATKRTSSHAHAAATGAAPTPRTSVTLQPRPVLDPLPGDPILGRDLYAKDCAACHGGAGTGDGPAAAGLHPRPRDHTDAWHLDLRSDRELHRVIQDGGPAAQRSVFMPAFGESLDPLDAWALVAHMRTLHPRVVDAFPDATRWEAAEAILPRDAAVRAAGAAGRLDPEPVDWRAAWLTAFDRDDRPLGRVTFPRVELEGVLLRLLVAVDMTGKPLLARTHPLVSSQAGRVDTDDLLARPVVATASLDRLNQAVRVALVQLDEGPKAVDADARAADALLARWTASPAGFDEGARTFLQSCALCHGATGRLVGAGVQPQPVRPRNLADPAFQASVDDAHLRTVIREGGAASGMSSVMPAHTHFTDAQLDAVVRYVRGLATSGAAAGGHGDH